jgi:hypothetical protein
LLNDRIATHTGARKQTTTHAFRCKRLKQHTAHTWQPTTPGPAKLGRTSTSAQAVHSYDLRQAVGHWPGRCHMARQSMACTATNGMHAACLRQFSWPWNTRGILLEATNKLLCPPRCKLARVSLQPRDWRSHAHLAAPHGTACAHLRTHLHDQCLRQQEGSSTSRLRSNPRAKSWPNNCVCCYWDKETIRRVGTQQPLLDRCVWALSDMWVPLLRLHRAYGRCPMPGTKPQQGPTAQGVNQHVFICQP